MTMATKSKYQQLKDMMPLYRIGEGFAVDVRGSITTGFIITFPAVNNINIGDFVTTPENPNGLNMNMNLQLAIKDLPAHFIFHQQDWQWFAPPMDIPNNHNFLNNATRKMYGDQKMFSHLAYIFITKSSSTFKDASFSNEAVKIFAEDVEKFQAKISMLHPKRMDDSDWLNYLDSVFALDHSDRNKVLLDIDFEKKEFGGFQFVGYTVNGDKCVRDYDYCRRNAEKSSTTSERFNSWTFPLTWSINCTKIMNNVIVREPRKKIATRVSEYESKLSFLSKMMQGSVKHAQEFKALMGIEVEGFEKSAESAYMPILHHYSAFYFLPKDDPADKEHIQRKIREGFSDLNLKPELLTLDCADVFMSTVGGCAANLQCPQHLYPAFLDEAVCFSNLEGSYAQNRNGIVFADSIGLPVVKDLFFEPYEKGVITNWNMNIIGPSGTGKSVLTNYLVSTLYYMDFFFVITDIGDSYQSLCELLKGKYVRADAEGKLLSTNPFLLPLLDPLERSHYAELSTEIDTLIATLFIAWDTDKSLHIENQNSRTVMEDLVKEFLHIRYQNKKYYVNFDDFYDFAQKKDAEGKINRTFFDTASFFLVMKKFKSEGSLGFLFNGQENLNDFSNYRMIVFELGAIIENAILFRLVTAMITMLTNRIIEKSKARMRCVWMDECWRMLMDDHFGVFIKMLSKTIRKKDGGIGIIVQELNDILKSPHADALIGNADTFVALSHEGKETQITDHVKKLNLTNDQIGLLLSIKKNDHACFIKQGTQAGVYGINITPEHYALFTSRRTEREALRKLITQNQGNIQMAIEEFVEKDLGAAKGKE
ncbi:hypothetical protein FACS1894199_03040 [Bacteroidia bacterium]|nr:hypothetical protein FACS1894199_03040 [Bacteroidia bacterium]